MRIQKIYAEKKFAIRHMNTARLVTETVGIGQPANCIAARDQGCAAKAVTPKYFGTMGLASDAIRQRDDKNDDAKNEHTFPAPFRTEQLLRSHQVSIWHRTTLAQAK